MVWFSNRAGSVDTFAGTSAISYEVQCNDLPSGGVDRTAVNNLAAKYVTVLPATSDSDFMFCLQSYQGHIGLIHK